MNLVARVLSDHHPLTTFTFSQCLLKACWVMIVHREDFTRAKLSSQYFVLKQTSTLWTPEGYSEFLDLLPLSITFEQFYSSMGLTISYSLNQFEVDELIAVANGCCKFIPRESFKLL